MRKYYCIISCKEEGYTCCLTCKNTECTRPRCPSYNKPEDCLGVLTAIQLLLKKLKL